MKIIKSLLIILTATFTFSMTAMGNTAEKTTKTFLQKQEVQKAIQKYLAAENTATSNEENVGLFDFFDQIKALKKSDAKQTNLKSALSNTNQLDSLLVERWNESTGSLEISQLEIWTWFENELGESWELYDLDSISTQWVPNDKEEYDWDIDGNKILHIDYDPDTINGGWMINGKESYTYDANNNIISYLLQFMNHNLETWEDNRMRNFTYDTNGNETESISTIWDTLSNAWVNLDKGVSSYDENGRLLKSEIFEWDTTQNDWICNMFMRSEYDEHGYESLMEIAINEFFLRFLSETIYDSIGNKLQTISYSWDFDQNIYYKSLKNEYAYNEDNMQSRWSNLSWNASDSSWAINWQRNYQYDEQTNLIYRDAYAPSDSADTLMPIWKIDYVNNLDGNPILTYTMNWEPTKNEWVNSNQEHINYDAEQRQNYFGRYSWDTDDNKWIPSYVEINEHDSYGNFLFHSRQNFDKEKNQWVDEFSDEYSYDLSIEFSNLSYPSAWPSGCLSNLYRFDNYMHTMLQKTYSEPKNNSLEITERLTFYYAPIITTGRLEMPETEFKVFPNPAIDYVQFELENASIPSIIEVYDLQGRKIISKILPANKQIAISHLKTGVYVYKLTQGSEVKQGKIIKK